jgi:glyoxylase-like metal-dependent hydrolase (beta-lactamase superfamily II)
MYVQIEVIETPELCDRSYVVRVGLVVETHIHNDYVTGGYELATRHRAPYARTPTTR